MCVRSSYGYRLGSAKGRPQAKPDSVQKTLGMGRVGPM
jgi:hypothetical protein